jgi:hypothetical protein
MMSKIGSPAGSPKDSVHSSTPFAWIIRSATALLHSPLMFPGLGNGDAAIHRRPASHEAVYLTEAKALLLVAVVA